MRVVVIYETQMLLLTVMFFQICHYCRAAEMDFKVGSHGISKGADTMVDLEEKILNSRQKSSAKNRGSWPLWPLSRFCWPCIVIYHMKSLSVSLSVSVSLSLSLSLSLCIYIYDTWSHAHVYIFTEITNLTYVSLKYS